MTFIQKINWNWHFKEYIVLRYIHNDQESLEKEEAAKK